MKNKIFRKAFVNNDFTGGSSVGFVRLIQIWLHNRARSDHFNRTVKMVSYKMNLSTINPFCEDHAIIKAWIENEERLQKVHTIQSFFLF